MATGGPKDESHIGEADDRKKEKKSFQGSQVTLAKDLNLINKEKAKKEDIILA